MTQDQFEEPPDFPTEYYTNLGHFVEDFARAEAELHSVLVHLSGLDQGSAKALLSGSRVENDTQFVRRLYEVRETPIPPALDKALSQLTAINNFRNLLLHNPARHWLTYGDDGSFQRGAVVDNGRRNITFWTILHPRNREHWDPLDVLATLERAPWRYKSPERKNADQKPPKKDRKRPRPPGSSPA